ncbi:hypothetical protein M8C21_019007 [Ambrosia artemisiifolia]|uniref:Uncharacterized protein n=1 Tax=Ambrosia artemisiifolia TaxID=4212 RepID=A0AAD5C3X1_AMBAR|nr:hypothetical protein M8C21_019007 [Ambrosia artemisiifolia]
MLSFLLGLKISWTLLVAFEVQAMGICCSSFLVNHFAKAFGYDVDVDEY